MAIFVLKRMLWTVPTFIGVTLVCFALMHFADADPIVTNLSMGLSGRQISSEAIEHLRKLYDLDKPWHVQYGRLLQRLLTLDLGTRWQDGRPIAEVLGEALPVTLLLSFVSMAIAYLVAIPLGVFSAVRQYSFWDQVVTVGLFVLYSLPSFWVGTMALVFLASGNYINCGFANEPGCFPLRGLHAFEGFDALTWWQQVTDVAWHLVLPLLTLTYNAFAGLSRYMRSAMLESLRQDYIRTARAKGLSERVVIFSHALRNSLIPIVTLFGLTLPQLIGGSIIVESIFGIRGMGYVALEAIRLPDYPLVITMVAFTAMVTVAGVFLSDVLYALVDPRIRLGQESPR